MKRATFLRAGTASLVVPLSVAGAVCARAGTVTTQRELFAALPRPKARQWTRIILGAGAKYQKQIGVGLEVAEDGTRLPFYEIQVGSPGGSCNPNSLRKAYLHGHAFGSLLDTYPLIANIGRSENLVFRYGDETSTTPDDKADSILRLLDLKALYDERPLRIVETARRRIHVASANTLTTYVAAEYPNAKSDASRERLTGIELWHSPAFPFGVAKYRATFARSMPFELVVYAHGTNYVTDLPLSLARVRAITKDGQYGPLPGGLGT